MTLPRKPTATKAGVTLVALFMATVASAGSVGTVTELDGNLLVARANGSVKVLGVGSAIEENDVLTSRKQTYATLTLADDSAVTLGPDTHLKVHRFVFDKDSGGNDGASFALAKGSVRIAAGLVGTRSGDTFELVTPTATLDMRRSTAVVEYVALERAEIASLESGAGDHRLLNMVAVSYSAASAPGFVRTTNFSVQPPPQVSGAARPPGLYLHVMDGMIHVSNPGGTQSFAAGQFGFTPASNMPPVIVPNNPGVKFAPPPAFSSSTQPQGAATTRRPDTVDCEVR